MKDKAKKDTWRKDIAWAEHEKEWRKLTNKERERADTIRKEEEIHREPFA